MFLKIDFFKPSNQNDPLTPIVVVSIVYIANVKRVLWLGKYL